jgi:hypothetical protein
MSYVSALKKPLIPALMAAMFLVGATSGPASAKQCVYNHGWFVLKITWLRVENKSFAREDKLTINHGSCTADDNTYIAILSIDGAQYADMFFKGVRSVGPKLLGLVPDAGSLLQGIADNTLPGMPSAREVFYTDVPSSSTFVDVWGTIWNPTTSDGGRIQ